MSGENEYDLFEELEQENAELIIESTTKILEKDSLQKADCLQSLFYDPKDFEDQKTKKMDIESGSEPQMITEKLDNNCILETIVKPGLDINQFKIDLSTEIPNPAKEYKFILDPFQRAAVKSIEHNDSVLVAAHTSAGKTAVAEYVIAKCLKNNQRVIYTSPIKALSNQKYRDLKAEFGTVGLVTGDVTLDENQTCLVMTTEILRNMLFRSNEIAKETAWIIFDEVHYMKDRERGVIWEETIILAPKSVRFCLLSATTPNASELAQWIQKIKGLDCINVIYTDYRPVPLEYYAFMAGEKNLLLLKNKKGEYKHENFHKITNMVKNTEEDKLGEDVKVLKKKGGQGNLIGDIKKIVGVLNKKGMTPGILFAFSKKDVELIAKEISKEMVLLDKGQQAVMKSMFDATTNMLSAEDQKLPQIVALYDILKSGIGLHHGGMLPILKELVELLFQTGLIKILVSTETFSMGVNMPAKAVVFTAVQKWDGEKFRVLSGSEFVQMAGRAGRRGLDDRGFVITMMDQNIDFKKFSSSLKNESKNDPLISQFALSYNMILNAMMLEGFEPEQMIVQSFKQFQFEQNSKKHAVLIDEWRKTVEYLRENWFDKTGDRFYRLLNIIETEKSGKRIEKCLNLMLTDPRTCLSFMNIGRLLQVKGCGWVPFINFSKIDNKIILDVCASINYNKSPIFASKVTCCCKDCVEVYELSYMKEPTVISVDLKSVLAISSIVIVMPQNMIEIKARIQVRELVNKIIKELKHDLPLLELVTDLPISDEKTKNEADKFGKLKSELAGKKKQLIEDYKSDYLSQQSMFETANRPFLLKNKDEIESLLVQEIDKTEIIYKRGDLQALFEIKDQKTKKIDTGFTNRTFEKEKNSIRIFLKLGKKVRRLLEANQNEHDMVLKREVNGMKKVLQRLEFFDKEEVLTAKGKVASRVFGADELLLTQLMFEGHLSDLTSKQTTVLLSFVVNEDRANPKKPPKINDEKVGRTFENAKKTLRFLNKVYQDCEMGALNEDDLLEKMNSSMFETIQKWYEGATFGEICKVSNQYEGNIIRGIKRLYELLKELVDCAESLGNKELKERFVEGQSKLYRGIVFAASLYL